MRLNEIRLWERGWHFSD